MSQVLDEGTQRRGGGRIRRAAGPVLIAAALFFWVLGVLSPSEPKDREVGRGSVVLEDGTPVTIYVPGGEAVSGPGGVAAPSGESHPLVVIAHGYVGDRVGLGYLAESLARNGYVVVTYDGPGHGQNENSFGSSAGPSHRDSMARVVDWAVSNRSVDASKIVVAGHSMGAATALEFASSDDRPSAVLAISGGWTLSGHRRPKNTLFIYASGDPRYLRDRVRNVASDLSGDSAMAVATVYGEPEKGDAVALVEVSRTDHLSIVTSPKTVEWLVAWLRLSVGGGAGDRGFGEGSTFSPAEDSAVASRSGANGDLPLFFWATILAYGTGRLTGRLQRGTEWIPLDEKFTWRRIIGVWLMALAAGVVVAKLFGPSGAVPLGLLSGLAVTLAVSGSVVAAFASYSKDVVAATAPRARGTVAFGVGGSSLLVLLAGAVSKLHNVALDPKRLVAAALMTAGFFPGFWAIEYLSRRGSTLRSLASSAVLKISTLLAVSLAIGIGAMHPVMVLGLPLLAGLFVYFEVFALAGFRSGASPAVIGGAEALTLGWIAAALGPLQF